MQIPYKLPMKVTRTQTPHICLLVTRSAKKASRGFEPRSLDSESSVLTVTPRGLLTTRSSHASSSTTIWCPEKPPSRALEASSPPTWVGCWQSLVRLGFLLELIFAMQDVVSLYSSVVERQSCKLKVLGSIPSGGFLPSFIHVCLHIISSCCMSSVHG